jgi:hypothetical protein
MEQADEEEGEEGKIKGHDTYPRQLSRNPLRRDNEGNHGP